MSLQSRLSALISAIGADIKSLDQAVEYASFFEPVRVVRTGALPTFWNSAASLTIDGVSLAVGDRVLGTGNPAVSGPAAGIFVVASDFTLTRLYTFTAADMGRVVPVRDGTLYPGALAFVYTYQASPEKMGVKANITQPPACRATRGSGSSFTLGQPATTLPFNTEDFDYGGMHDIATNNSRIVSPVPGLYQYTPHFHTAFSGTTNYREFWLRKNGSQTFGRVLFGGFNYNRDQTGAPIDIVMAAGDYVEAQFGGDASYAIEGCAINSKLIREI